MDTAAPTVEQLLSENRALRVELDAVRAELAFARNAQVQQALAGQHRDLVSSDAMMRFFGYTARPSFWHFVHSKGVPTVRLNKRRVMFDPVAVNAWLAKRGTAPIATPLLFALT